MMDPYSTEAREPSSRTWFRDDIGRIRAGVLLGIVSLAVLAFAVTYRNTIPFGPGHDPFDYITTARRLVQSRSLRFPIDTPERLGLSPRYNEFFVPEPYVLAPDGQHYVPAYTPGTSLLMSLFILIFGEELGPYLCGPVTGAGCIVLMYVLARRWFGRLESLLSSILLACSPVFLAPSRAPLSDVPALFGFLLTLILLVWPVRQESQVLTGLAFGYTLLIRLNLAVLTPALLVGIWCVSPASQRWKRFSAFGAGLALMLILHGALNASLYGSPFTNGYSLLPITVRLFAVEYFPVAFPRWLLVLLMSVGPVTLMLAVYSVIHFRGRLAVAGGLSVAGIVLLFSCFRYTGRIPLHRFMLTCLPILILGALAGLSHWGPSRRRVGQGVLLAAGILNLLVMLPRYNLLQPYSVDPFVPDVNLARIADIVGQEGVVFSRSYCGRLREEQGLHAVNWARGDPTPARELLVELVAVGRSVYIMDNEEFGRRAVLWLGENVSQIPLREEGTVLYRLGPPLPTSRVPQRRADRKWRLP